LQAHRDVRTILNRLRGDEPAKAPQPPAEGILNRLRGDEPIPDDAVGFLSILNRLRGDELSIGAISCASVDSQSPTRR